MQRMMVVLPADLYLALRHHAVDLNTTQSAIVEEAVRQYLAKVKEKKAKP